MDYFLIFQCAMLLAGKTKQQEVVLQEEVVIVVQNCPYFFLCCVLRSVYGCYFFSSIPNAGLRIVVCKVGTVCREKSNTDLLSKQ